MKWSVYILLMAALIYVSETIRLPFQLAALQEQEAKNKRATLSSHLYQRIIYP